MRFSLRMYSGIFVAAIGVLALAGCAPIRPGAAPVETPSAEVGEITGTITLPEGEAIPAGARVEVDLLDMTLWTPVVSATYTPTADGFPVSFALSTEDMAAAGPYGVAARVVIEGKPRFITLEPASVQIGSTLNVNLMLASNDEMLAPEAGVISGTLNKMDRMALPSGTGVIVDLLDLTDWTPVATDTYTTTGEQVPLPFSIEVTPDEVSVDGVYGLMARFMIGGRPMYVTMEPTPVHSGEPMDNFELMLVSNAEMLAPEAAATQSAVTGVVTSAATVDLPVGAKVIVRLQDISRADAPATLISEQVITTTGEQLPIPFILPYDAAQIDDRFTYSVSVRIEVDGKLSWISDTMTPVITRGAPTSDVEVAVVKV